MEPADFEKLEYFNVLYDSAIDQEDFNQHDCRVVLVDSGDKPLADLQKIAADQGVGKLVDSVAKLEVRGTEAGLKTWKARRGDDGLEASWFTLLMAKRIRHDLQEAPGDSPGAFDEVGHCLSAALPPFPKPKGSPDDLKPAARFEYEAQKALHVLYLLEMSAAFKHYVSIGFAKRALTVINEIQAAEVGRTSPYVNVYELLALLNQGAGHAHTHEHGRALGFLDGVREAFALWESEDLYANEEGDYRFGKIRNGAMGDARSTWQRYALFPAVLFRAEVLSDLNRSTEQVALLAQIDASTAPAYWKKRALLLGVLAKLDGGLDPGGLPKLDGEEQTKPALVRKWEQTDLKKAIEISRRECEALRDADASDPALGEIATTLRKLAKRLAKHTKEAEAAQGPDEIKDAYVLWVDYLWLLDIAKGLADATLGVLDEEAVRRLQTAAGFFSRRGWFPDHASTRKRLLKLLRLVNGRRSDCLKDAEMGVLGFLVREPDTPLWQKTEAARRLQVLGSKDAELASYELPDRTGLAPIVTASEGTFCQPSCGPIDADCAGSDYTSCRGRLYQRVLERNQAGFERRLTGDTVLPSLPDSYCLAVLRRWQSFTPALASGTEGDSKGGGYFVFKTAEDGRVEEGIVVDPGFDFIENFFHAGFTIGAVDAVAMTHAHVDHTADFLSLVTLVSEYNEAAAARGRPAKSLLALMASGCYAKFSKSIEDSKLLFKDVVVAEEDAWLKRVDEQPAQAWTAQLSQLRHFRIGMRRALHDDLSGNDSYGLLISAADDERKLLSFTGDTMWWQGLAGQHREVPTVCANIGGIVPVDAGVHIDGDLRRADAIQDKILLQKGHLYWPGFVLMQRDDLRAKLVIVAELCEELKGGIKRDFVKHLDLQLEQPPVFLPEDVGLLVQLRDDPRVLCIACERPVAPGEIEPITYGTCEATYYACKGCLDSRRETVMERVRDCDQRGWPERVS